MKRSGPAGCELQIEIEMKKPETEEAKRKVLDSRGQPGKKRIS